VPEIAQIDVTMAQPLTSDSPRLPRPSSQTVAAYVASAVPIGVPSATVGDVRHSLAGRRFDSADVVFVVDDERRLCGALRLTDVLAADGDVTLSQMMDPFWPRTTLPSDREEAATLAIHTESPSLAVVDDGGRLIGALPGPAIMAILRDEHLEDLHHMAGILGRSRAAREALAAPPPRRVLYRLPWLLAGMAGSAAATALMAGFEGALSAHISIAFFVPAIVYLADAVGTQTEAVAVRGLSLTADGIVGLLTGEIMTGLLIGLALALVAFPLVLATFGDNGLAATVALALFGAAAVATTLGFLLPLAMSRLGVDPAWGSGPIATVIQDVLSLLIYFSIASILVF
jgi:magnesium transporter